MTHKLPQLPYDYSALEPHIDTRTMAVHHDKHHAAYVRKLNDALEDYPELQNKPTIELIKDLDTIPEEIQIAVRNNGGGHVNHSLFWPTMSSSGGGVPSGSLGKRIDESFGSFDTFKEQFSGAAVGLFGVGWAWLCVDQKSKLIITTTQNQDNPISKGLVPILGLDVWEHAYYLKYENRRPDYVAAWWNVVNWSFISGSLVGVNIQQGADTVAEWAKTTWSNLFD